MKDAEAAHRVHRLLVELSGASRDDARGLQDRVSALGRGPLAAVLESAFDEVVPAHRALRVERMELDIGHVSRARFDDELLDALGTALRRALRRRLPASRSLPTQPEGEVPVNAEHVQRPGSSVAEAEVLLRHFARTGRLPWWASVDDNDLVERSLSWLLVHDDREVRSLIAEWTRNPTYLERVLANVGDACAARLALVSVPASAADVLLASVPKLMQGPSPAAQSPGRWRIVVWRSVVMALAGVQPPSMANVGADRAGPPWPVSAGVAALVAFVELCGADPDWIEKLLGFERETGGERRWDAGSYRAERSWLQALGVVRATSGRSGEGASDGAEGSAAELLARDYWNRGADRPRSVSDSPAVPGSETTSDKAEDQSDREAAATGLERAADASILFDLEEVSSAMPGRPEESGAGSLAQDRRARRTDRQAPTDSPSVPASETISGNAENQSARHAAATRLERAADGSILLDPADVASALPGRPGESASVRLSADDESWAVRHCGLVLLWPFLPRLFERVGLYTPRAELMVSPQAPHRAAALLEFLATAAPPGPEYRIVLVKILAGLRPDAVFVLDEPLTNEEEQECETLLAAALGHAEVFGDLSRDGFRRAYLRRPGLLTVRDGAWLLCVETEPQDLLLDRLPWSLDWVRLPWMEAPMRVEW